MSRMPKGSGLRDHCVAAQRVVREGAGLEIAPTRAIHLALPVTIWLPCGPSPDTAGALTAAIARTNARIRCYRIENAHGPGAGAG